MSDANSETPEFSVGDRVRVSSVPAYVKTADPMPMLRPPNVIHVGEEGVIVDRRPGNFWSIQFAKGTFLLDSQYIEPISESHASPSSASVNLPVEVDDQRE
ncbi:MAG: regulatory protein SipA [Elainellaceae cyanobacterium]